MTNRREGQLALALPHEAAMTRADFLAGRANEAALHWIDRFPDWPGRAVLLAGPPGSGKTHLGRIWQEAAGAARLEGATLRRADVERAIGARAVLVEDIHEVADEAVLFHLLNRVREAGAHALLTSRRAAGELPFTLPDLRSRLRAALPLDLAEPDDDLLGRVIVKLFADRQLPVDASVVEFLLRRIERSLGAANRIVAAIDRHALETGRPPTRQLAAAVLGTEEEEEEGGDEGDRHPA